MPLVNATPFAALDVPMHDRVAARRIVVVIVKAAFVVKGERVVLEDEPPEVRMTDVLRDESRPNSSALYPSDICPAKHGADVLVIGEAVSRERVTHVDVAIRVRERTVPLRVHGVREYFRALMEVAISAAVPFERMPIEYERAYGGATADGRRVEMRNRAGVGVAASDRDLVGKLAPQIEHPAYPFRTSADRHAPVGCSSILPEWSPRLEHAGTMDEQWRASRAPLLPEDFDVRHYNVAHPSLIFDHPLAPDDAVSILGMTPDLFAFRIARMPVVIRARYDDRTEEERPAIDTLLVEPSRRRFEVSMRRAFPIGRGRTSLRELRVDVDE